MRGVQILNDCLVFYGPIKCLAIKKDKDQKANEKIINIACVVPTPVFSSRVTYMKCATKKHTNMVP